MNKYFFNHDLSPLLGLADSQIITFIGGGGKTSLMNTLGKEFASHGYPTLLTTTTHIMKPDFLSDESYIENENLGQLANIFTNLKKNSLFSKNRYRNRRNRTFLPRKTNKRNTFSLRTTSESYFFR